jgi:single-strand DNA-binding protein
MANYNKVILVGNLTRDPQMRYLPSQMPVVDFGLAVNHRYKTKSGEDREEVCFIDCSAFGRQAEVINQYCRKGRPLLVEGRLKFDTWEDKQGGGKRSKHTIVIDNFQLLGGRDSAGGGGGGGYDQAGGGGGASYGEEQRPAPPRNQGAPPQRGGAGQRPAPAPEPPFGEEQTFQDDDIPF